MSTTPVVTVYTRQGCGLCATAEERAATEAGRARLELVDVDGDEELLRRHHLRVPVVAVDGHEVAVTHVAPGVIATAVRRARWRRRLARLRGDGDSS